MNETNSTEPEDDHETIVVRVRADREGAAHATAGSVGPEGETTVVRALRSGRVAARDIDGAAAQQRTAPAQTPVLDTSLPRVYGPRAESLRGAEAAGGSRSRSQPAQAARRDRSADEAQPPGDMREQLPSFARRTQKARVATLAGYVIVVCVSVAGLWAVGGLAFAR